jgi:hypothetical protein
MSKVNIYEGVDDDTRLNHMLYVSGLSWDEDDAREGRSGTHEVKLTLMHTTDFSSHCWILGCNKARDIRDDPNQRPGWFLVYLYTDDNLSGDEVEKPIFAAFIPDGVRLDTLEDVYSYAENPRWETHRIGELRYGFLNSKAGRP